MIRRNVLLSSTSVALCFVCGAGSAEAQYDYGGGSRGGRTGSADSGVILFIEGALANPRNTDNVVATSISGSTTFQIIPVWDDDPAARVGVGYQWPSSTRLVLSAWGLTTEQSAAATSGTFAFPIGPPIATGVGDGFIGDTGNSFDVTTEIEARTADLAWSREFALADDFALEWSLGLRYALFEETHQARYGDGASVFDASKSNEGEMVGAKVAARGSYRVGSFSFAARMGFSTLAGEISASSSLAPNPPSFPAASSSLTDDSRSGSIRDFDAEVSWHAADDRIRLALGWEQAEWRDIASDVMRNFNGTVAPLRDRGSVVFSSFRLGAHFLF